MINFSLNHMTAASLPLKDFAALSHKLEINKIEIRNDLEGVEIVNGCPAEKVREITRGLDIISINALQRFNDWTDERAEEACQLAKYASDCGAQSLVLCPVNSYDWQPSEQLRRLKLKESLTELKAILRDYGITGLVEPLGFAECSLRYKREAVEMIEAAGGQDIFRLTHDTFHHFVSGEQELFPEMTGLVHLSGVEDTRLDISEMRDEHRVLVTPADRLGNIEQIRVLLEHDYKGTFSFEPFAESVHSSPTLERDIRASMKYIAEAALPVRD